MMVTALLFDLPLGWSASALPHTHLKKGEPIDYKSGSPAMHESKQTKGSFFFTHSPVLLFRNIFSQYWPCHPLSSLSSPPSLSITASAPLHAATRLSSSSSLLVSSRSFSSRIGPSAPAKNARMTRIVMSARWTSVRLVFETTNRPRVENLLP